MRQHFKNWLGAVSYSLLGLLILDSIILIIGIMGLYLNDSFNNFECSAMDTYASEVPKIVVAISAFTLVVMIIVFTIDTIWTFLKSYVFKSFFKKISHNIFKNIERIENKLGLGNLILRFIVILISPFILVGKQFGKINDKIWDNVVYFILWFMGITVIGTIGIYIYKFLFTNLC